MILRLVLRSGRIIGRFAVIFALLWPVAGWRIPVARGSGTTMEESSDAMKKELIAVIDAQLAAFRDGDFQRAYGFAAQGVKTMFPATDFEKMVRTGYPLIARSASAEYGMALNTEEDAAVAVRVIGADEKGTTAEYLYTLSKENGTWKITGVSEVKPGGIDA